jgi:hypothetical protein
MVFVAITALNFAAMRALFSFIHDSDLAVVAGVGALPMANILAVGILIGQRRTGSRPFLLGFEAFGTMALALYLSLARFFPDETLMPYLSLSIKPMEKSILRDYPLVFIMITWFIVVVTLGLPQVGFAFIGGFLSRKFRITISVSRRPVGE